MDNLRKQSPIQDKGETLLERAVRRELKRLDMARAICSSHRTAGTASVPAAEPKKVFQ